jgi:hypothetical protein
VVPGAVKSFLFNNWILRRPLLQEKLFIYCGGEKEEAAIELN